MMHRMNSCFTIEACMLVYSMIVTVPMGKASVNMDDSKTVPQCLLACKCRRHCLQDFHACLLMMCLFQNCKNEQLKYFLPAEL